MLCWNVKILREKLLHTVHNVQCTIAQADEWNLNLDRQDLVCPLHSGCSYLNLEKKTIKDILKVTTFKAEYEGLYSWNQYKLSRFALFYLNIWYCGYREFGRKNNCKLLQRVCERFPTWDSVEFLGGAFRDRGKARGVSTDSPTKGGIVIFFPHQHISTEKIFPLRGHCLVAQSACILMEKWIHALFIFCY